MPPLRPLTFPEMQASLTRLSHPIPSEREHPIRGIRGNARDDVKRIVSPVIAYFQFVGPAGRRFADEVGGRVQVKELDFEEKEKGRGRLVCEVRVARDMVNGYDSLHGGCTAYLIDICTAILLVAQTMKETGAPAPKVSQEMNIVYHAPAHIGTTLRIISTILTLAPDASSGTARCEIFDTSEGGRLVASGTQTMVSASFPDIRAKAKI